MPARCLSGDYISKHSKNLTDAEMEILDYLLTAHLDIDTVDRILIQSCVECMEKALRILSRRNISENRGSKAWLVNMLRYYMRENICTPNDTLPLLFVLDDDKFRAKVKGIIARS